MCATWLAVAVLLVEYERRDGGHLKYVAVAHVAPGDEDYVVVVLREIRRQVVDARPGIERNASQLLAQVVAPHELERVGGLAGRRGS